MTIRALEQVGAVVVQVRYDDSRLTPDHQRFESGVRRDLGGALSYYQPDRLTIVGKSRGTDALRLTCEEEFAFPKDTRLIWLTPVWRSDPSWRAACSTSLESLYVVGLADTEYHDPDRHGQLKGETVAVPNADHRLEISGDISATLDAWRTMAEAVARFAGRR